MYMKHREFNFAYFTHVGKKKECELNTAWLFSTLVFWRKNFNK